MNRITGSGRIRSSQDAADRIQTEPSPRTANMVLPPPGDGGAWIVSTRMTRLSRNTVVAGAPASSVGSPAPAGAMVVSASQFLPYVDMSAARCPGGPPTAISARSSGSSRVSRSSMLWPRWVNSLGRRRTSKHPKRYSVATARSASLCPCCWRPSLRTRPTVAELCWPPGSSCAASSGRRHHRCTRLRCASSRLPGDGTHGPRSRDASRATEAGRGDLGCGCNLGCAVAITSRLWRSCTGSNSRCS